MIKTKGGVKLPPMAKLLVDVHRAFSQLGSPTTITAGEDGEHMENSKHYTGEALDFRTKYLSPTDKVYLRTLIRESLGKDFDVVLESTHLHVEYDPK